MVGNDGRNFNLPRLETHEIARKRTAISDGQEPSVAVAISPFDAATERLTDGHRAADQNALSDKHLLKSDHFLNLIDAIIR